VKGVVVADSDQRRLMTGAGLGRQSTTAIIDARMPSSSWSRIDAGTGGFVQDYA